MAKIMFISVTAGATENYCFPSMYRIAEVTDEVEYIGHMRARIVKALIDEALKGTFPGENIDQILRTLRVKLQDTGLTEYPDTPEAEAALFERMTQWQSVNTPSLTATSSSVSVPENPPLG